MKKRETAGPLAVKNSLLFAVLVTGLLITGCGRQTVEQERDITATENIVITETGEIIETSFADRQEVEKKLDEQRHNYMEIQKNREELTKILHMVEESTRKRLNQSLAL